MIEQLATLGSSDRHRLVFAGAGETRRACGFLTTAIFGGRPDLFVRAQARFDDLFCSVLFCFPAAARRGILFDGMIRVGFHCRFLVWLCVMKVVLLVSLDPVGPLLHSKAASLDLRRRDWSAPSIGST